MPTMYDIDDEYRRLEQEIEGGLGEITPELEEALRINAADRVEKTDAYLAVIRERTAIMEGCAEEISRLCRCSARHKRVVDRLEGVLLAGVLQHGTKKHKAKSLSYEATNTTLSVRTTRPVVITGDVPDAFLHPQKPAPARAPDKARIARRLKAGMECDWAKLGENQRLVIK